jgi:hypothetical protein
MRTQDVQRVFRAFTLRVRCDTRQATHRHRPKGRLTETKTKGGWAGGRDFFPNFGYQKIFAGKLCDV